MEAEVDLLNSKFTSEPSNTKLQAWFGLINKVTEDINIDNDQNLQWSGASCHDMIKTYNTL